MLDFIEKEKLNIEEFLKDNMEHKDKKVDYILYNPKTKETNVLASNLSSDEAIEFTPYTKNYKDGYSYVPEWDYNFDYYIYNLLEEGWQIGYMTPEVHWSIWNSIHELYPEDIDYKKGVQSYLQYCADNGITKEFIDKNTNFDTPDIMKYYETPMDLLSEKAYISFVLGYDLLQDMLKNSDNSECDVSYDFCDYISEKYMKSPEYRNPRYSSYEMLEQWIRDNKNLIQYEYNNFIGKQYETYNDKTVLLTGDRNGEPIALVEKVFNEKPEYIIAFNYKIKDDNLSWGYGYYYEDDVKKAFDDYQTVICGGNIANTFVEKEIKVKLIGIDNWDRPVYKDEEGNIYKDVNLGNAGLDLHTVVNNDFYGEPNSSISNKIKVRIIKSFNKNRER